MKVLQVNCVYKSGSTGKITADLHAELPRMGIESVVCYGRGGKCSEPNVYKTCGEFYSHVNHFMANLTGVMYGGCLISTRRLMRIIEREQPDVVHLQCINGYFVNIYRLINWLKKRHIRTVLTLHAEFMYTGGCGHSIDCTKWSSLSGCGHCPRWRSETRSYLFDRTGTMWRRMKRAFEGFGEGLIITSVSPWLMERAKRSSILTGKRHSVVLNGLDTSVFTLRDTRALRERHGCTDKKVIFHATPGFSDDPKHIKGGYYLMELARRMPDVQFIVAGDKVGDFAVPENMTLLGKVTSQTKLAEYYSMADITVLTSLRETFSMICAESLSCGTPMVGFRAGAPEQISLSEYSSFVDFGDVAALEAAAREMLGRNIDKQKVCDAAAAKYGKDVMCRAYAEVYRKVVEG